MLSAVERSFIDTILRFHVWIRVTEMYNNTNQLTKVQNQSNDVA